MLVQGSNPRPPARQTCALPTELTRWLWDGEIIQDVTTRDMIDPFMMRMFVICDRISRPLSRGGTIYWELWIRSQQPVSRKQNNPVNSHRLLPSESSSVPQGYWFKFHKGGDCLGYGFKHSCPKCEGAHRLSVCTFRGQSKQTIRTIAVMSNQRNPKAKLVD